MANLGQYYGRGFPLGATLTMEYMGDLYTAPDGGVWVANTPTAPFAYTSTYSGTPNALLSPHALMTGPRSSLWYATGSNFSLAYKASATLYCTGNSNSSTDGDSTNGYNYFTSTNGGSSWTTRTFPNTKSYVVGYTASLFVGCAISSTTNAIITSTDAVTWTSLTGISQSTVSDIVSNGSTQILIFPQGSVNANYSVDSGATWANANLALAGAGVTGFNTGAVTWNAGAGLYIGNSSTAGAYQTSPTGATWTSRPTQATFSIYPQFFGASAVRFASSSTVTVAVGTSGFFATSTDGLTWANQGFITTSPMIGPSPTFVYYDGTRFVVGFTERIFYSTNGTSWTEGRSFGGNGSYITNDRMLRIISTSLVSKAMLVTDPTSTTAATVCKLNSASAPATTSIYTRIL